MVNQDRLKTYLKYNPTTGAFTYLQTRGDRAIGSEAGTLHKHGHIELKVEGVSYRAHRLAYLYMTGELPVDTVDHIDRDQQNNAWSNLRQASAYVQQQNRGLVSTNKSGVSGVYWNKGAQKWHAQLRSYGERIHLGFFDNLFDAVCVRRSAEQTYGVSLTHGGASS